MKLEDKIYLTIICCILLLIKYVIIYDVFSDGGLKCHIHQQNILIL